MHPAILPAALAFSAASAMALYVLLRRDKSEFHWLLLAVLTSLMVWTLGTLFRFSVRSEEGLIAALRLVFLGVLAVPPLWLTLAAHYARFRPISDRRGVQLALLVPSLLAYLGLLTNEAHRLFIREVSFRALESGAPAWAGPVFWAVLCWGYVCVIASAVLYFSMARRLASSDRSRGFLLAVAAPIPCLASLVYVFRLFPVPFDLTPTALVFTVGLVSFATFRYQLFESLPLTRRDVIEHLGDGVVIANATGAILDTNPAAAVILGTPVDSLRGRDLGAVLRQLAGDEAPPEVLEGLRGLAAAMAPLSVELHTADDRRVDLLASGVRHEDGEPAGQYAVLRDRTEERRYARAVQQTQKLETVGTLAAGIAHEVNNPLAFIRANLTHLHRMGELVDDGIDDPASKMPDELRDLRQVAEETLDGIGRIERIVADMRRLSSEQDEVLVSVDVNEVVGDALRLANLSRFGGVEVRTYLSDGLPHIDGAPQRLVQALLNLLVNARQVLEGCEDAVIEIVTLLADECIEIRVRDNGPGIPQDIRDRIFDPFFTTKDPDQGTGLGLSITLDIFRDHGGDLEVSSSPKNGTTFIARIPVHWE